MDNTAACYPPPFGSIHNPQYPYSQAPFTHAPPTGEAQPPTMMVVAQPQQFHPHPHHLQPPFAPYATQSYVPLASYDEVRTLCIAGLPADVKPREIYNLFREFTGYESSHLRARFANTPGLVFDLEKNSTLYNILQNLIQDLSSQELTMKDLCQRRG